MRKALAVAAVVGILVVAGLAYFGGRALAAGADAQNRANAALQGTGNHALDYDNGLRLATNAPMPRFDSSSSPDFTKIKQASDSVLAKLDQVRMGIRSDQSSLGAAGVELQAAGRNPLVAPLRSGLDRSQRRVGSMMAALDAADTALGFERDAIQAVSALMDEMNDYAVLEDKEGTGDVAASLSVFDTLDPKVQTALQSVEHPNIPADEVAFVRSLATLIADEKAVLQATQAGDGNRVSVALAAYDTDSAALLRVDTDQINGEETTILQPYKDRYESGMKAAGFGQAFTTQAAHLGGQEL